DRQASGTGYGSGAGRGSGARPMGASATDGGDARKVSGQRVASDQSAPKENSDRRPTVSKAGSLDPGNGDRFAPWPDDDDMMRGGGMGSDGPPPGFNDGIPMPGDQGNYDRSGESQSGNQGGYERPAQSSRRKPGYEREILRLMLQLGHPMVEYIGSQCNEDHFSDADYKMLFVDMVDRYENGKPISLSVYTDLPSPFPELVGEVVIDRYTPSARKQEGLASSRKKDVYKIAKGELKSLKLQYLDRLKLDFQDKYTQATDLEEKKVFQQLLLEVTRERVRYEHGLLDELFPNPDQI
ncbi:MAG: hypothetical protein LAT57_11305, partial [Balneolales bacterium]|nr:hypothetical protein [Balneolales bacterium]